MSGDLSRAVQHLLKSVMDIHSDTASLIIQYTVPKLILAQMYLIGTN